MKNIRKGTCTIIAESNRGRSIIINKHGGISFCCSGYSYAETSINELTELIAMAIKFRDQEKRQK